MESLKTVFLSYREYTRERLKLRIQPEDKPGKPGKLSGNKIEKLQCLTIRNVAVSTITRTPSLSNRVVFLSFRVKEYLNFYIPEPLTIIKSSYSWASATTIPLEGPLDGRVG